MIENITINFRGNYRSVYALDVPSNCPHCGRTMSPKVYEGYSRDAVNDNPRTVGVLAQCPFDNCGKYYGLEFKHIGGKWSNVKGTYKPKIKVELPENIEKVSAAFVEIYSQATVAESEGLDQIAGVGYRKAAEFLIKDYAISKNSTDAEDIKKQMLGKVIREYFDDFPKIQQLATAIAWIGNDETHYVRRHDDRDISDLKRFIKASAQFIAADYDADEALNFTTTS